MLTNTFCHIPGVGEKTEQRLWSAGVTSWEAALPLPAGARLPRAAREGWDEHLRHSIGRHRAGDAAYFAGKLPAPQQWRMYWDFRDRCAFLDIETTGLGPWATITTIALYDGRRVRSYVNGRNLDDFPRDVHDYALLVTYNGVSFDLPCIEQFFGIRLAQAHIDLRYVLKRLGLTGGLKGCEQRLGIRREGLEDIDGFAAVLLWNEYRRRGNAKALETLLAYNVQDAVNLHRLMVHAHNARVAATPFAGTLTLSPPAPPELPFRPDPQMVERVRRAAVPYSGLHRPARPW
jgi:hypothetical protein